MKIDGKAVSSFENTTIPLSCITPNLGINNFETSTFDLYQTSSVLVYNEKEIAGKHIIFLQQHVFKTQIKQLIKK